MLESVNNYNALSGVVCRDELIKIAKELYQDEQHHLSTKLSNTLSKHNTADKFDIDIINQGFETVPTSLMGCLECVDNPEEEFTGLNKSVSADSIYQMVTDKIIKNLENAEEWKKPFNAEAIEGFRLAINFITKKPYRSVNQLILGSDIEYMYGDGSLLENPYYLTFKQIEKLGGKVKKGTVADQAIYYTVLYTYKDIDKNIDYGTYDIKKMNTYLKNKGFSKQDVFYNELPILKYYNVFNGKDITGIDFELETTKIVGYVKKGESKKNTIIDSAEAIIKHFPTPKPKISITGKQPLYKRKSDAIEIPNIKHFDYSEAYYTVLFHEHIHATGSKERLDRKKGAKFGDKDYAFEELIAEIGASFLSSNAGILHHTLRNGASYIKNWYNVLLKILKEDNRFIFKASTQAQKAADFILQPDKNGVPKFLKELENSKKTQKKSTEKIRKPQKRTPKKVESKESVKVDKNGQFALLGVEKTTNSKFVVVPNIENSNYKTDKVILEKNEPNNRKHSSKVSSDFLDNTIKNKESDKQFIEPKQTSHLVKNLNTTSSVSVNNENYNITGDIAKFLGNLEVKPKDSLAITLDAEQGAGKTRFLFQLLNEFASSGYKCLFVSLEEHPESSLFNKKVNEYINPSNNRLIDTVGELPNWFADLKELIPHYDCIFIDSWSKIAEEDRSVDFDKDLRKGFDSKLFVTIFQRTSSGKMRGGSKSQFDGDVILRMEKAEDYRNSYVYANKNRYQDIPLDSLKYNIFTKSLVKTDANTETTTNSSYVVVD